MEGIKKPNIVFPTREPKFVVAVGKKGIGKTFETKRIINEYIVGDPKNGVKPRKVLVFDVNNEFTDYDPLDINDVPAFAAHPKIECRRIVPFVYDPKLGAHRKMGLDELAKALQFCLENFWSGMILIEDITKFISDSIPSDLIGSLATQRHIDVDVICHFQGIGKAGNPKIKANMNELRFHKCLETVERHRNKFDEYSDILKIAEVLVNNRYNEGIKKLREFEQRGIKKGNKAYDMIENQYCRFFVYVSFEKDKIYGKFSKEEFLKAIESYISDNSKDTITPLLNRKDRNGKKIYKYAQAYEIVEKTLTETYYGNPN